MPAPAVDLAVYCQELARRARSAGRLLATARTALKNRWLRLAAEVLEQRTSEILAANGRDLAETPVAHAPGSPGMSAAQVDRLRLTPERIRAAAAGLREVAEM